MSLCFKKYQHVIRDVILQYKRMNYTRNVIIYNYVIKLQYTKLHVTIVTMQFELD